MILYFQILLSTSTKKDWYADVSPLVKVQIMTETGPPINFMVDDLSLFQYN